MPTCPTQAKLSNSPRSIQKLKRDGVAKLHAFEDYLSDHNLLAGIQGHNDPPRSVEVREPSKPFCIPMF